MPNEDAFYMDDREATELAVFSGEPCMENCAESIEVTARATVLNVTPEGEEEEASVTPAAEEEVVEAAAEPEAPAGPDL